MIFNIQKNSNGQVKKNVNVEPSVTFPNFPTGQVRENVNVDPWVTKVSRVAYCHIQKLHYFTLNNIPSIKFGCMAICLREQVELRIFPPPERI